MIVVNDGKTLGVDQYRSCVATVAKCRSGKIV